MVSPSAELLPSAKRFWQRQGLPALAQFIQIPCLSPDFDPDWADNGHIFAAANLIRDWVHDLALEGAKAEILQLPGLTPLVVVDVPAYSPWANRPTSTSRPTLLYGHLDKQPPVGEWRIGDGPYSPVRKGDSFYGRGAADDGYAVFAALGALQSLRTNGIAHGPCVVVVEASEESMSVHLAPYLNDPRLTTRLGPDGPGLVVCLDSGCPTYDRLWVTTSMRGHLVANLRVDVLADGVHSGGWGGLVPSSFRVLRQLLSRIEDERTGTILIDACSATVPPYRLHEVEVLATQFGSEAIGSIPHLPGDPEPARGSSADVVRQIRAQTWEPSLAVTGADGLPSIQDGGSLIRPFTAAKLSIRLTPSVDPERAARAVRSALVADPPEGARVSVEVLNLGAGFDAPPHVDWLSDAVTDASLQYFGRPAASIGRGGTNPFLSTMRGTFPDAQFLATGVNGPGANTHAPDEMLHVPTVESLTACIAHVLSRVP
jgi:acetylornithine deacetylase/succinyl-diaminopimelate desuccinylase-like protein